MSACTEETVSYHDQIMDIVTTFMSTISNTSITPTGQVIDVLLDIRNLTSEWEAMNNA